LDSTGHEAAARHLVHERRERATRLAHLEVHAVDGRNPWSHQRFVAALMRNSGLPEVMAGEIALRVERQLAALKLEVVAGGLVSELASSALLVLDGSAARAASLVQLSPRELGAHLGSAGGDPQLADRLFAAAALEKLMLLEVHSGVVARAASAGEIALPGVGDPLRAAAMDITVPPSSVAELARWTSRLLPLVRGNLRLFGVASAFAHCGDAMLEALVDAVRAARGQSCRALLAVDLPCTAALAERTRHWRRDFGIEVAWRVVDASSEALVASELAAGASFLLREVPPKVELSWAEVVLDLLAILNDAQHEGAADLALVRARSLVCEVESQHARLLQGNFLATVLAELGLPHASQGGASMVRLKHLGEALRMLVQRGVLRAQDRPRWAARVIARLLDIDPAASERRFQVVLGAPAPRNSSASDSVLPLGWPLDAPAHAGLLSPALTHNWGGSVALPAAMIGERGARATLAELGSRTALNCVHFVAAEAASEEVQGDLFPLAAPR
jgi:hypothetical protein